MLRLWFQNDRARGKTKQLEKDYGALKFNYSALKMDYQNLQKVNDKFKAELIFLADKLLVQEKEKGAAQWKNSESINNSVKRRRSS